MTFCMWKMSFRNEWRFLLLLQFKEDELNIVDFLFSKLNEIIVIKECHS